MAPATLVATTSGTKARVENSKSSSSIASTTAASGAPKVAAIPAAAPQASRILRSLGRDVERLAEQGPERAAGDDDRALGAERAAGADGDRPPTAAWRSAVRGAMRLWRMSTASIASGMPWPRMIG